MEAPATPPSLVARVLALPRTFFLDPWRSLDDAAAAERAARAARGEGYDSAPLVAFCAGAVLLALMEYWGNPGGLYATLAFLTERGLVALDGPPRAVLDAHPFGELAHHAWWALWRFFGFFVVPALIVRLRGERIRDQGLSAKGLAEHAGVYVFSYVFVLALVLALSRDAEFTTYYPFYKLSHRSWLDFVIWELLYVAQFFGLEFFFRGYWLEAGRRTMGSQAIFAMVVPYVMIHFGKPLPETLAATFAGVWLGTLAMRTGSIWGGFFVHVAVAISMDVAALLATTGLPRDVLPTL